MSNNTVKKDFKYVLLLLLVLTFAIRGIIAIDPDFGWRLRTGYYILQNGVPKTDLYSYTMSSFPWVDHAWMTDVFISIIDSLFGKVGLGVVFSIIAINALLITISGLKYHKDWLNFWWRFRISQQDVWVFSFAPFLLAIASIITFSGIRAQVITWLFFALFLKIIFDNKIWLRYRFLTPLLFGVWANFHGGFVAGLGVFWTIMLIRFWTRRTDKNDLIIILISTLLTFFNPYGFGVYKEVWSSVSDNSLHFVILEWQPAFLSFDVPSLIFIALSSVFVTIYRKKFAPEQAIIFYVILFQGISSVRHFPLFVLYATPLTVSTLEIFHKQIKKDKEAHKRFVNLYSYFWLFCLLVSIVQLALSYKGAKYLSDENFYPGKAINYLENKKIDGNLFSDYAWGGYLIWKYPDKQVFIDGRMPSWKWKNNPPGESGYVMKDYLDIVKGKEDYNKYFEKYNIRWALLPKQKPSGLVDSLEEVFSKTFNSLYKLFNIDETKVSLAERLKENGWAVIYEDDVAQVYKKE